VLCVARKYATTAIRCIDLNQFALVILRIPKDSVIRQKKSHAVERGPGSVGMRLHNSYE
jgi:hypothetical protein